MWVQKTHKKQIGGCFHNTYLRPITKQGFFALIWGFRAKQGDGTWFQLPNFPAIFTLIQCALGYKEVFLSAVSNLNSKWWKSVIKWRDIWLRPLCVSLRLGRIEFLECTDCGIKDYVSFAAQFFFFLEEWKKMATLFFSVPLLFLLKSSNSLSLCVVSPPFCFGAKV